jgi:hypothetical protein
VRTSVDGPVTRLAGLSLRRGAKDARNVVAGRSECRRGERSGRSAPVVFARQDGFV